MLYLSTRTIIERNTTGIPRARAAQTKLVLELLYNVQVLADHSYLDVGYVHLAALNGQCFRLCTHCFFHAGTSTWHLNHVIQIGMRAKIRAPTFHLDNKKLKTQFDWLVNYYSCECSSISVSIEKVREVKAGLFLGFLSQHCVIRSFVGQSSGISG